MSIPYINFIFLCLCKSTRSASAEMVRRAKQCLQLLKDFQHLLFFVLVQDILEVLSWWVSFKCICQMCLLQFECRAEGNNFVNCCSLSLKLPEDGLTLPRALHAFETSVLMLIGIETESGEHVADFLAQTPEGSFHNVQLVRFSERREGFSR